MCLTTVPQSLCFYYDRRIGGVVTMVRSLGVCVQILLVIFITMGLKIERSTATPFLREAKSIKSLLEQFKQIKFSYIEHGLVFGHISIESCLFVSDELILLKHYCFPAKNYVAQGYTLISKTHGILEFYEEDATDLTIREIDLKTFPDLLKTYLHAGDWRTYDLKQLNPLLQQIYELYVPGCWSINYDFQTEKPRAACGGEPVHHFADWAQETQSYVNDENQWQTLLALIETQLP